MSCLMVGPLVGLEILTSGATMQTLEISYGDFSRHVPAKFEVCARCGGTGQHVNTAIDGNGLTAEDLQDDDFREAYMQGAYDVSCERCNGQRVVLVVDLDSCSIEERAAVEQSEREERAYLAEVAAERRYFGTDN